MYWAVCSREVLRSLSRSLELTVWWDCVVGAGPVHPVTQDDALRVWYGVIGWLFCDTSRIKNVGPPEPQNGPRGPKNLISSTLCFFVDFNDCVADGRKHSAKMMEPKKCQK